MKGLFLSVFFFIGTFGYLFAQGEMPVKWTFSAEKITNQEYELIMTADVEKGWYVYSQTMDEDGPIPTNISFDEGQKIERLGDATEVGKKKEAYDEMFEMQIVKYADKVKFLQKVKIEKGVKVIKGEVEFMTCDDHRCLPPTSVPFTIKL